MTDGLDVYIPMWGRQWRPGRVDGIHRIERLSGLGCPVSWSPQAV